MAKNELSQLSRRRVLQLAGLGGAMTVVPKSIAQAVQTPAPTTPGKYSCPPPIQVDANNLTPMAQLTERLISSASERRKFDNLGGKDLLNLNPDERGVFLSFNPDEIVWKVFSDLKSASASDDAWHQFLDWTANVKTFLDCWPPGDVYDDPAGCRRPSEPKPKLQYAGPKLQVFDSAESVSPPDAATGLRQIVLQGEGFVGDLLVEFQGQGAPIPAETVTINTGSTFRCGRLTAKARLSSGKTYQAEVQFKESGLVFSGHARVVVP